jgi:hypothetical protein
MNDKQRAVLTRLCERFHVPFDERAFGPASDLPAGWVSGQVGPIYVGCSPEGDIHS